MIISNPKINNSNNLQNALIPLSFMVIFLLFAALSFRHQSVVGDTMLHYYTGKLALGEDWKPGDPLGWDGTMPISALNVVADRYYLLFDPNPKFPEIFPFATINRPIAASLPSMFMGSLIVLLIWACGCRWLGKMAGSFAAFLAALEPNLLGNARWITTDVPAMLTFLGGLAAIGFFVEKPTLRRFFLMALIVAIAQLAKVTNLILIGFAGLAVCYQELSLLFSPRESQNHPQPQGTRIADALLGIFLKGSFLILTALYALQIGYGAYDPQIAQQMEQEPEIPATWAAPLWELRPLVPAPYAYTVGQARLHNSLGHSSFFLGEHNSHGDWRYFPFAILVKTPLPLLILAGLGLWFLRRFPRPLQLILGCCTVYLIYFCFFVNVNIGIRHVLPFYPALLLLAAAGAQALWATATDPGCRIKTPLKLLLGWLLCWYVLIASLTFPHYSAYFNPLVGGSYEGWKYLSDSNVDFDQDRNQIYEWIAKQKEPVHLHPSHPVTGLIVTRALLLNGITEEDHKRMEWLREEHEPIERLSPAVFVYRVNPE